MGLQFHGKNRVRPGGPSVSLTPPDMRRVKHIIGDGNCLFRSLAYIVSGSDDQHMAIRTILEHMIDTAQTIISRATLVFKIISDVMIWTKNSPGILILRF